MIKDTNPPRPLSPSNLFTLMLATCLFISYGPSYLIRWVKLKVSGQTLEERKWTGAGLLGTIAGLVTFLVLPKGIAQSIPAISFSVLATVYVTHQAEKILGSTDDSRIVLDEWIGVWIALWGFDQKISMPVIFAVIVFRIFDVWKGPWGRRIQKWPGGWGITFDDVGAGLLANVCTRLLILALPTFSSFFPS